MKKIIVLCAGLSVRSSSKFLHIISATDSSCGAGAQQDVRVAHDFKVWPITTVSGVTAQTFNSVIIAEPVSNMLFQEQLSCSTAFNCLAVKIGALLSIDQMIMVYKYLLSNSSLPVVMDPVFAPTAGNPFYTEEMKEFFIKKILPLADLITPNLNELEIITGDPGLSVKDAAIKICNKYSGKPVFYVKGGHDKSSSKIISEYLIDSKIEVLKKKKWDLRYTHGTGCAMATAAACFIIRRKSVKKSALLASRYITNLYKRVNRELS